MNGNTRINMASDHNSIMASFSFGFISRDIDIEDRAICFRVNEVDCSAHRNSSSRWNGE